MWGIIGLGNLGSAVAQVGQAFGMQVLAARQPYDPDDNQMDVFNRKMHKT